MYGGKKDNILKYSIKIEEKVYWFILRFFFFFEEQLKARNEHTFPTKGRKLSKNYLLEEGSSFLFRSTKSKSNLIAFQK